MKPKTIVTYRKPVVGVVFLDWHGSALAVPQLIGVYFKGKVATTKN